MEQFSLLLDVTDDTAPVVAPVAKPVSKPKRRAKKAAAPVAVAPAPAAGTPAVLTVSEITTCVKNLLEEQFATVWVVGEVSGFRPSSAGHWYFSLKDDTSLLNVAMFRGVNQKLPFKVTEGMVLICRGRIEVYKQRGSYQLIADAAEPQGVGALQLAFEQLKMRLQAEGLFDRKFKIPLPAMPKRIGVVTSPTGAVIRDILNVVGRRFPAANILLAPARVQGDGAAAEVAQAIATLDRLGTCDVIIVARGGGSIEDLWAFNEEVVARAIFACRTPIVSAVGHEIDFTIADFVADVRAPTPSAAAELVVPSRDELRARCVTARRQLMLQLQRVSERASERLRNARARLRPPTQRVSDWTLQIDHCRERLRYAMENFIARAAQAVAQRSAELSHLSPLTVLSKGYAVVTRDGTTEPVRSVAAVQAGDILLMRLSDGTVQTRVEKIV